MKKIQVTYFFEDSGFCKDVFKSVDIPHYYYNRDTASGVWYTSTPDYYANDRRIQQDVIIEVVAGGRVIALDGNGDFEGKRPFVPFNEFEKSLANSFAGQQPKLRSYERNCCPCRAVRRMLIRTVTGKIGSSIWISGM